MEIWFGLVSHYIIYIILIIILYNTQTLHRISIPETRLRRNTFRAPRVHYHLILDNFHGVYNNNLIQTFRTRGGDLYVSACLVADTIVHSGGDCIYIIYIYVIYWQSNIYVQDSRVLAFDIMHIIYRFVCVCVCINNIIVFTHCGGGDGSIEWRIIEVVI